MNFKALASKKMNILLKTKPLVGCTVFTMSGNYENFFQFNKDEILTFKPYRWNPLPDFNVLKSLAAPYTAFTSPCGHTCQAVLQ